MSFTFIHVYHVPENVHNVSLGGTTVSIFHLKHHYGAFGQLSLDFHCNHLPFSTLDAYSFYVFFFLSDYLLIYFKHYTVNNYLIL